MELQINCYYIAFCSICKNVAKNYHKQPTNMPNYINNGVLILYTYNILYIWQISTTIYSNTELSCIGIHIAN